MNNKIGGICVCCTQLISTAFLPHAVPPPCCEETDTSSDSGISYLSGKRTWMSFTNIEKEVPLLLESKLSKVTFQSKIHRYGRRACISKGIN